MKKRTIAIVAGGDSSEIVVSLRSAQGIYSFIDKERYNLYIPESDEYDTLAGYIISRYEELPTAGTVMEYDGLRIKILSTTRSRIELARVEIIEKNDLSR